MSPVLCHGLGDHRLERLRKVGARLEIGGDDVGRYRNVADGDVLVGIKPGFFDEVDENEGRGRTLARGDDRLSSQIGQEKVGHWGFGQNKSAVAVCEQCKIDESAIRASFLREARGFRAH